MAIKVKIEGVVRPNWGGGAMHPGDIKAKIKMSLNEVVEVSNIEIQTVPEIHMLRWTPNYGWSRSIMECMPKSFNEGHDIWWLGKSVRVRASWSRGPQCVEVWDPNPNQLKGSNEPGPGPFDTCLPDGDFGDGAMKMFNEVMRTLGHLVE